MDIVLAELGGIAIATGLMGFIFKLESWEGTSTLFVTAQFLGFGLILILLVKYIMHKENETEYRFSLKLLSRLVLINVLLFYLF